MHQKAASELYQLAITKGIFPACYPYLLTTFEEPVRAMRTSLLLH